MDLAGRLEDLGMGEYLDAFRAQSFDSWSSVLDITEQDLYIHPATVHSARPRHGIGTDLPCPSITLGVDLGHRRKLQRAIATERGLNLNEPLQQDEHELTAFLQSRKSSMASDDDDDTTSASLAASHLSDQSIADAESTSHSRRRYRRRVHQRDPSRPERPLTGYVRFSRDQHKCYRHKKWTFAQLAKQIGEDWRDLDASKKEAYLRTANREWDRYRKTMEQLKLDAEIQSPVSTVDSRSLLAADGQMSSVDLAANVPTFPLLSPAHTSSNLTPTDAPYIHSPMGISEGCLYIPNGFPGDASYFADRPQQPLPLHPASLGASFEHNLPTNYSWTYGPSTPHITADEVPAYGPSVPLSLKYEDCSTSASSSSGSQGVFPATPAPPGHVAAILPRPQPASIWIGATQQQHLGSALPPYHEHARHQQPHIWGSAVQGPLGVPLPFNAPDTPETPDSATPELGVS